MALDLGFSSSDSTGAVAADFSRAAMPDYLLGADNHNLGNSGSSWFDPTSWRPENSGKFIAVAALSGANSIYNSAVTVTNWFGNDVKMNDTQSWIGALDQDLGQYYSENRQAADLAGFVATSFVPGIGGIKILNAGQSALRAAKFEGTIGKNMSMFTNILAPATENYVKLASAEIKANQAVFTTLNGNTLKALGAGIQQNVLEGAAFETFVQATMFKSPVLEDQDGMDIVKNIAMGGLLGGAIGGAFEGAKTLSTIKKARVGEDLRMKQFNSREIIQPGTAPSDRIILAAENRELTPLAKAPELPVNPTAADQQLYEAQLANAQEAIKRKSKQIDLDNRSAMHELDSGAGKDLVNAIADTQIGIDTKKAIENWHNAVEVSRPTVVTKMEAAIAKDPVGLPPIESRWISIAGETAGQVSHELPPILNLADRVALKGGASIADSVLAEARSAGFKVKDVWDPIASAGKKLSWRDAESRFIWADNLPESALKSDMRIGQNDLPLLERMLRDGRTDFTLVDGQRTLQFDSVSSLKQHIVERKDYIANEIMRQRISGLDPATNPIETITAAISKVTNTDVKYLEGVRDAANSEKGLFSWQDATAAQHALRVSKGVANVNDVPVPIYLQPTLAKINYAAQSATEANGHVLDAMVQIKAQQKILREDQLRVFTKQVGNDIANRIEDVQVDKLMRANSEGAGAGLLTFAKGAYGSIESQMQKLGGVSRDMKIAGRKNVDDQIQSALYNLAAKPEAAIEFSSVNQLLSKTAEDYVFDSGNLLGMGTDVLIPNKLVRAAAKSENGLDAVGDIALQPGAPQYIKFDNWETAAAFKAHTDLNANRVMNRQERYATYGKLDQRDPTIVRGVQPNPKDFPYFAFVKDPKVTGAGHTTMLFANSEKELQGLIAKTNKDFPDFEVLTKKDTKEWYEAHQSYEYNLGLNENYIDSAMKRNGIYSNFYTQTDPKKIVNDVLQFHYRGADQEAAELMRLRHGEALSWLEDQASQYSNIESSQFKGASIEKIQQNEKNPYISYIKTALDLSSVPTSNPWWSLNKFLDTQVSKVVGQVRQTFDSATSPAELTKVNELLDKYGSQTSFNSGAEMALVNHTAPKAELSKFVRGANAIMSRFTLGLDPLNALNNAIGANVLRGTELYQLTKAIRNGNTELAGELGQIAKVAIPGVDDSILSPAKLMARSVQRMMGPNGKALMEEYRGMGIIRDRLQQFAAMQDDLALQGTETVKDLSDRLGSAFSKAKALAKEGLDKGEKYSGNNFAEEFNRFVSADVMRQLTDVAQKHGILNAAESTTYINSFVNRVEGNIIASQRPGLFQGPLGQAIGLFQSYQFNLLQNLFRYVAEGEKKDIGMLLGIQGTLYGLQGEPGFKFLNDHIVGTLSGNPQHRDIYDATRGILGKTGGDWLLYGAASNILQTNIYSRGDINPRSLTIVPTSIADVPFVGGMGKVFGTLYETAQKLSGGGNVWETIRQGIEHNGISRPLAGLAQVSRGVTGPEVFSTSGKGTILGSNDLMSLASLSRLAGGRPLDEAIQNDTMFSINSYEAVDRRKKNLLAETVRTTQLPGQEASGDQLTRFAEAYALTGGKQGSFGKYMMEQYTKSNTSQAQMLSQKLANPLSYKIQQLMGGEEN